MTVKFSTCILIAICFITGKSYGQASNTTLNATKTIKAFYVAHNNIWSKIKSTTPAAFGYKLDSLNAVYCTPELRKQAKKFLKNDFDLMTNEHGISDEAIKTMTITKEPNSPNIYKVMYDVGYSNGHGSKVMQHPVLLVSLKNMDGQYKIEAVK